MENAVTLAELKAHLSIIDDADDLMLQGKIDAAQRYIERELGYRLLEQFETVEAVPADLREAILQLAACWFENREALADRLTPLPYGVAELLSANRDWSF